MDITVAQLGQSLGVIAGIVTSVTVIYTLLTRSMNKRFDKIEKGITDIEEDNAFILQMQSALILHEITGNHIVDMQKLYNEVEEHRTKKKK